MARSYFRQRLISGEIAADNVKSPAHMKKKRRHGAIITIGSFDGVHCGHQALIERTVRESRARDLFSLALTFSAPPKMVLHPKHPLSMINTPEEKYFRLKSFGLDKVQFLDFDLKFSKANPFYFFKYVLLGEFRAKGLVVGLDFRFGNNRAAGAHELVRWGQDFEIPVWVIPPVAINKVTISSSLIRQALINNKFADAISALGHAYDVFGPVVKGRGVGKKLGFPTANIETPPGKILPQGVFVIAGEALDRRGKVLSMQGKKRFQAVGNIGVRPTFLKQSRVTVETHSLSGPFPERTHLLRLHLLKRLRGERKFATPAHLQNAIKRDILKTTTFFTERGDSVIIPPLDF
jgi:riboflavin kinase / FMN adenylyltransferase